jgi:hypothetical protein
LQGNSANVRAILQQLAQLAGLHDALTREWVKRCEREHAPISWTRNAIWSDAFEVICERSDEVADSVLVD